MPTIELKDAVGHILEALPRQAGEMSPFFFLVGAGISVPIVPLAREIQEECRARAERQGRSGAPPGEQAIDAYSHWFHQAYPHPRQRQRYLRELIEGKPISAANLRLAHLLLDGSVTNLVVTPNFDDLLSRALILFGKPHILCDHPRTVERIDQEQPDVQIVHVHGTYWFYDCCNLKREVEGRAQHALETILTMASLLDNILAHRSPIVIGYSGWEGDVFMSALRRRLLSSPLAYNLYWFCHCREDFDALPSWLRSHASAYFVAPAGKPFGRRGEVTLPPLTEAADLDDALAGSEATSLCVSDLGNEGEGTLSAPAVLDEFIRSLELSPPPLTEDPLGFFASQVEYHLGAAEGDRGADDIYLITSIVQRLRRARDATARLAVAEEQLEKVRAAVRRSDYGNAIVEARRSDPAVLGSRQLRELADATLLAARGVSQSAEEALVGYDLVARLVDAALLRGPIDREALLETQASALQLKAMALHLAGEGKEQMAVYDDLMRRLANETDSRLRQSLALTLAQKGVLLVRDGRIDAALDTYDHLLREFGDAADPETQYLVATALVWKGFSLGLQGRNEEAIAAYDEVAARFADATSAPLRECVASALKEKGHRLHSLGLDAEAMAVYDDVVARFGRSPEPGLQRHVAAALFTKGRRLQSLSRHEEAIAVYDEVARCFLDATDIEVHRQVAYSLSNKAGQLGALRRNQDAIAACDELVACFGDHADPNIRQLVAKALRTKGSHFARDGRAVEAVAACDELVRRFGEAAEMDLQHHVLAALMERAALLLLAGRVEEALSAYDEVAQRFCDAADPRLQGGVALALLAKGDWLRSVARGDEAETVYEEVVRRFQDAPSRSLRRHVAQAERRLTHLRGGGSAPAPRRSHRRHPQHGSRGGRSDQGGASPKTGGDLPLQRRPRPPRERPVEP